MSRPLRIEYPGAWYHVACRGNQRLKIFGDDKDRKRFLKTLRESAEAFNVEVHCYVLLRNHFHFLLRTPEANLGRFMHRFNTAYITYYNLRHHRSGHLYQGRYKAILVEADEYLLELSRYIHLNPVRFKKYRDTPIEEKSKILKDYSWSSLPGYLKIQGRDDFMRHNVVLAYMGGDNKKGRIRYRDFVLRGLTRKLANPLAEVKAGAILGNDSFVVWVKEQFMDIKSLKEKDYPGLKELKKSVSVEEIAIAVAKEYGTYPEKILRAHSKRREARQVLIELSYQTNFRKKSLMQLGEELGGVGGDSIAHTHKRIQKKMKEDKKFARRVNRIYQEFIR
jgi:REP element-mobilizing transposase RayT